MAALYPQYANSSEAKSLTTFRYLERMYTLDPKSGEIIVAISEGREGTRFDSLWGDKEKRQADDAIETIESLVIKPSDLDVLKTVLFDVYYDRATAEFILANRSIDEARIQWIEQASISTIEKHRQQSFDILLRAFDDYWKLIEKHPQEFASEQSSRNVQSARYLNGDGNSVPVYQGGSLIAGYKDALLAYQLMNELLAQQLHLSKLKAVSASPEEQKSKLVDEARSLLDLVLLKEKQLSSLLGAESYTHIMLSSELGKFKGNTAELKSVITWLKGDGNYFGLPDDFVVLMPDYNSQENVENSSFESLEKVLSGMSHSLEYSLNKAQKERVDYHYQLDSFTRNFAQENSRLKERLFTLLGCSVDSVASPCKEQTKGQRQGSLIGYQLKSVQAAKTEGERAYRVHRNVLKNISIEIERIEQEQQANNTIDNITVKLGLNDIPFKSLIDESRQSTLDMNSVLSSEEVKRSLDILGRFLNDIGSTDLSSTFSAIESLQDALKGSSLEAELYIQKLALLERSRIKGLRAEQLDVFTEGRIKELTLELETAKADMAKSLSNLVDDAGRLVTFSAEAQRLVAQIEQNEYLKSERSYANPLNFSALTVETSRAESQFSNLQEWLFYAVQALEYKWQESFYDRIEGFDKNFVFKLQNTQQSTVYLDALKRFDDKRYTPFGQKVTDVISLKEHIFGYIDNHGGKTIYYPAPDGSGDMLTADEAFNAKLKLLSRNFGFDKWLTVEFSTVKNFPKTNLFHGPILGNEDDVMCLEVAGNYSDKIDGISINLAINYDMSGESATRALLTYGGNNYMRSRIPGVLMDDGQGLKGDLISYSTRFADISNNGVVSKSSFKQSMKANIMTGYHDNKELLNPTYSFKERSVAASGWRLSLQLGDEYGDIVETEAIDDIQVIVQHNLKARRASICSGESGPL
ncbi:hypothetical protein CSB62_20585 [Vibrio splendidus]|uniref:Uncharacterized protein n=1 Tax=Vibrio lentus TaxID=136468 RepID=A0A4U2F428_9VIBR|nr:hypothetical protein CSB62_20585 [Vibrio splendidus]PML08419.1 hypothetical protein BCT85_19750 [Vibrio lentus]TKF52702.1 hypothetical protein FCV63_20550 [Vibrio lentus]TKG09919.1 hypothetical protein FCV91_09770 [Vibrio lentus]